VNLVEVLGRFRRKLPKNNRPQPENTPFDDGLVDLARLIDDSRRPDETGQQRPSHP
jgi:hypothetical protein